MKMTYGLWKGYNNINKECSWGLSSTIILGVTNPSLCSRILVSRKCWTRSGASTRRLSLKVRSDPSFKYREGDEVIHPDFIVTCRNRSSDGRRGVGGDFRTSLSTHPLASVDMISRREGFRTGLVVTIGELYEELFLQDTSLYLWRKIQRFG